MSPPSCARYELPAGGGVRGAEGVQASSFEAVADSANRAGPSAGGGGAVGAGPVGPPRACARSRPSVGARRAAGGRSGGESRWTPAPAAPATPPPHAGEPSHYRWGTDKSGGGRHPHRVAPPPVLLSHASPCRHLPPLHAYRGGRAHRRRRYSGVDDAVLSAGAPRHSRSEPTREGGRVCPRQGDL